MGGQGLPKHHGEFPADEEQKRTDAMQERKMPLADLPYMAKGLESVEARPHEPFSPKCEYWNRSEATCRHFV